MSRIGKLPVAIPKGVEVKHEGQLLHFKGTKHTRDLDIKGHVNVKIEADQLLFSPVDDSSQSKAFWGTYRVLASNIVTGLTDGFERRLDITGVGYRATVKGDVLELALGYSHPINYGIPKDIEIAVEKNTHVIIKGVDKQVVGQVAAEIRGFRPPEPYKGKGVRYSNEVIVRKAGKTSKK